MLVLGREQASQRATQRPTVNTMLWNAVRDFFSVEQMRPLPTAASSPATSAPAGEMARRSAATTGSRLLIEQHNQQQQPQQPQQQQQQEAISSTPARPSQISLVTDEGLSLPDSAYSYYPSDPVEAWQALLPMLPGSTCAHSFCR